MTMTLARLEDLSLQHWLKGVVLPVKWVENITGVPLTYNDAEERFDAQIVWLPNFLEEGRGWVYFDPQVYECESITTGLPSQEQSTRVTVYNAVGGIINPNYYTVDYKDGAIIASGNTTTPDGVPTTVDFFQYYVSLLDAWPGTEPPTPPIVAVEMTGYDKVGRQLGLGRIARRNVTIHIFATSSAERDDLTEFLYDALYNRHIPIVDFREGEPLRYDGTFNPTFSGTILQLAGTTDGLFYFRDIRADYFNMRNAAAQGAWSDLNRWRSKITFFMESYRDSLDFNVV